MQRSERQQEILEVAVQLIATQGIQGLTIKNISSRIGISEPAIYRHFTNKQAILFNVIDMFEEVSMSALSVINDGNSSSLEKLEAFIMNRYETCAADRDLAKVMFSEENFQNDPLLSKRMLEMMHAHRDVISTIIGDGQRAGEIRTDIEVDCLFRIIFGPVRLLIKQWCLNGFAFSLVDEGRRLWKAERTLLLER